MNHTATGKTRLLGWLSLVTLVLTVLWLALLIYSMQRSGPVTSAAEAMAYASAAAAGNKALHTLTYLNAAFITLVASALMAALSAHFRRRHPFWAAIGLVFIPVYTLLNLFAYLSQVTIVPRLAAQLEAGVQPEAAAFLLAQMVQAWPGSLVSVLNNLGYAVLGVSSIIFGALLVPTARTGGLLLALNGVACILGFAGILAGSSLLSLGSLVGGVLFLLALIPLTALWLRAHPTDGGAGG